MADWGLGARLDFTHNGGCHNLFLLGLNLYLGQGE